MATKRGALQDAKDESGQPFRDMLAGSRCDCVLTSGNRRLG
jgi:hypothetical protein